MASLTNYLAQTFDDLYLRDETGRVNIRDLFGAAQSSVPPTPAPTDVLNITGLNTLLAAKRDVADSYTNTQTDTLLAAKRNVADSYSNSQTDMLLAFKRNFPEKKVGTPEKPEMVCFNGGRFGRACLLCVL